MENLNLKKQFTDPEHPDFERVMGDMIEDSFSPKHENRTQEERQKAWDEKKAENSKKFDAKNVEQTELF